MLLLISVGVFGFDVHPSIWLFPSLILGAASVVGIGLIVGVLSKGPGEAAIITSLLVYVLSYATPVFYPLESLPRYLQVVSAYLPTTHAAAAVSASLQGEVIPVTSLVILGVWTVLFLGVIAERLDWRLR